MNFLRFWFPVIVYSAIIFAVSSIPGSQTPSKFPVSDKLVHAVEYGIYAVLIARAWVHSFSKVVYLRIWLLTMVIVVLYGISDEIHQSFVPGRTTDIADPVADAAGGALAAGIYLLVRKKHNTPSVR